MSCGMGAEAFGPHEKRHAHPLVKNPSSVSGLGVQHEHAKGVPALESRRVLLVDMQRLVTLHGLLLEVAPALGRRYASSSS